jgi:hypothetical protein
MRDRVLGKRDIVGLEATEFALFNDARASGDGIAESVGGIVAAQAVIVRVGFEHVFRAIGIVLEGRQTFEEASAALVDEELRRNARARVTEAMEDFAPAVDAVHVGGAQGEAQADVLLGNGGAVALMAKDIGAGDEAGQSGGWLMVDG